MSIEAMTWAMNLDHSIVSDSSARHVLLILGNHARSDGSASFPSVATIMRNTGLSRRTVQVKLRELRELGVIKHGNQGIAHALGLPADRTPTVYNICMFEEIKPLHDVERGANSAPRADDDTTGRKSCTPGAQITTQRGADSAPEPSRTKPHTHSDARDEIFTRPDPQETTHNENVTTSTGNKFSMDRDWRPDEEKISLDLIRRGLPTETIECYDKAWLHDFTAYFADKPCVQKSEAGWTSRFAQWIQQNLKQPQLSTPSQTGDRSHEKRQQPNRQRLSAAEARARDQAKRSGGTGAVIEGNVIGSQSRRQSV